MVCSLRQVSNSFPGHDPSYPCPSPLQDKLAISRKRMGWMLSPLVLWFAIVLIVYLLQYYWLASAEERVMGGCRCSVPHCVVLHGHRRPPSLPFG